MDFQPLHPDVGPATETTPALTRKQRFYQALMLLVAMGASGWIGMKMVIPPGYASPLWPPAGVALAGIMIGGRRLWPVVWLGATFNNILVELDFSGDLPLVPTLVCGLIGLGSSLQAVAAERLSARCLGPGLPKLSDPNSILLFFLLTGPLACLTAASIGVTSLYLINTLRPDQLFNSWINWWIGDSLGVMIVAPVLFCLVGEPRQFWRARLTSVALPLAGNLLALILVFSQVFAAERARIQQVFDSSAGEFDRLLAGYIVNVIDSSLALRDLFQASSTVTRRDFRIFSQGILARHPEIQALEWLPRVERPDLPGFERAVQREGFPQFKVTERSAGGTLVPVSERDEYFPILYLEPLAGNERAFGFDSLSNSISKQAKDKARQTGKPSLSQGFTLIQTAGDQTGLLLSIPVYADPATADPAALRGFVSAVLLPDRMLNIAAEGLNLRDLGIEIRDLTAAPESARLLFTPVAHDLAKNYSLQLWQHEFTFFDRRWQLAVTPSSDFVAAQSSSLPWVTLIGGLFFTSLLNAFLLTISGRNVSVTALVDERTRELEKAMADLQASAGIVRESELKLRTIVESEPECVKLLAQDGSLLQMNRAGLEMIEADSFEQAKQARMDQLVLPKYRESFKKLTRRVFAGASGTLEFEIAGLKGGHHWLDTHAVPMRDANGNITALLGLTRDITERKLTEEHLKLAARVFSDAHEGILITDAGANIIDVNPTFCEITGYSRNEIIGQNPRLLQSGKYSDQFYRDMWQELIERQHWQGELWNRKKSGELYAEWLTISALTDADGNVSHYIGLFSDVTQTKQQQQMLELYAHYDPLTHLPNRILFADRLNHAMAHCKREKSLLSICFLDLDGFKPINDQFGHDIGDRVLIEVAGRIKAAIREEDSVSRHGGDEFTLLLGDIESVEQCEQAILRIHRAIGQPYLIDGQQISVGASSGFTVYPLDDANADALLRHADHAMYQAKLAGKNRCQLFDSSRDQQIIHRHQQLRDIETGFVNGELRLYFQPKVNIKTGEVAGAEALIRWQHPERGLVPPLEFLPVMASTDLEIRIGNWVIAEACRQLSVWHRQGLRLAVSVNISSYHLLWPGIQDFINTTLNAYPQIDSRYLQLEILESTALDDLAAVNRIVKSCREQLGINVALDDFGTGYSSLTHLRHLSVDTVKIDQTFVRDMLDDPDDYAIIESVIALSQAFNREVVAEGVESPEQGIVLLLLGCHLLQGYAIARPMPADDLVEWVQAYRPAADWQFFAGAKLSPEQIALAIRQLDTQQWLKRVQNCVFGPHADAGRQWPIMDQRRSHLGRWLKQAQHDRLFTPDWLARLEQLQGQMHQLADTLMRQSLAGQTDMARDGFAQLQAIHHKITEQLRAYQPLHGG